MRKKLLLLIALFPFFIFSQQNGFTFLTDSVSLLTPATSFTNPAVDNNGHVWIAYNGTIQQDLWKYDGTNWTKYSSPIAGQTTKRFNALTLDAANAIWIVSNQGVFKFDGSSWTLFNTANSSLLSDTVFSIDIESNNVWLGTKRGLSKFDGISWTNYTRNNSNLISDTAYCISADGPNDIWLGQRNYLSHFNGNNFTAYFKNFENFKSIEKIGSDHYVSGVKIYKFNGTTFTSIFDLGEIPPGMPQTGYKLTEANGKLFFCNVGGHSLYVYNCATAKFSAWYFDHVTFSMPQSTSSMALSNPVDNKVYISGKFANNRLGYLVFDSTLYLNDFGLGPADGANLRNYKYLDVNEVKAGVTNRGDKYWDMQYGPSFEVPKGNKQHTIHGSALWLSGLDNANQLCVAASYFRQHSDFWPGPLDTLNCSIDSSTAFYYDKIWKIDQQMLHDFQQNFLNGNVQNGSWPVPQDILDWPAHGTGNYSRNLAPFVDVNGDGIYTPLTDGDYPKIKGDQSLYCIFNDKLVDPHPGSGGKALGVEVHYETYSFYCPQVSDTDKVLNYTVFNDYTIINRNNYTLDSLYASLWRDPDIGYYNDDFVACDPNENFGLSYNADIYDESGGGSNGYHYNPPIQSRVILNGPTAYANDNIDNDNDGIIDESGEKCMMTNFFGFINVSYGPPGYINSPIVPQDFRNYSQSRYKDSTQQHICNLFASPQSNFIYPYPPYTSNPCSTNTVVYGNDWNIVPSAGPFRLLPGEKTFFTEALVYTQDTSITFSPYDSTLFIQNHKNVRKVKKWHAENNFPSCYLTSIKEINSVAEFEMYPNPANEEIVIKLESESGAKIEIYDARGRICMSLSKSNQFKFLIIPVNQLSNGIYFVSLSWPDGKRAAQKFVVQKN